jgi:nitrite reductase/ring-hydroxylating ferredoxin subunit
MLVRLLSLNVLSQQAKQVVNCNGRKLLIVDTGSGVHVVSALCPHRGAPLVDGTAIEGLLVCPWHRSTFSLETGEPIAGPCSQPLTVYPSVIKDEAVYVDFEAS